MDKLTIKLLAICSMLLTGCAAQVTMTGKQYPPVDPLKVKILFSQLPACHFEELAFITSPLSWNQSAAIQKIRDKSASIGADYVDITSTHVNLYGEVLASGVAYKCGIVDREEVELKVQ